MYDDFATALEAPHRSVIVYDRRCAGASDYTLGEYFSVEILAMDAVLLVRALGFS